MKLTLTEAARTLGKSPRQLRYLMKQGELKGEKVEGRWVFDDTLLPRTSAQKQRAQAKAQDLLNTVEEVLAPQVQAAKGRAYSVADLQAFRTGAAECREALAQLGEAHAATAAMRASVVALGRACHRYHPREKAAAFLAAREEAAAAVAHLHIDGRDAARTLADTIEQKYLSSLVGLLRRQERKEHA